MFYTDKLTFSMFSSRIVKISCSKDLEMMPIVPIKRRTESLKLMNINNKAARKSQNLQRDGFVFLMQAAIIDVHSKAAILIYTLKVEGQSDLCVYGINKLQVPNLLTRTQAVQPYPFPGEDQKPVYQ